MNKPNMIQIATALVALALAMLSSIAASQTTPLSSSDNQTYKGAMKQLDTVWPLIEKHNYAVAEATAEGCISRLEAAGLDPRRAHVEYGRALLADGRADDAILELGWSCKPGYNARQDLLVAMAGEQSSNIDRHGLARSALLAYFLKNKAEIAERFGSADFMPHPTNPDLSPATDLVYGLAALLYAADPSLPVQEARDYLAEASRVLPDDPRTHYTGALIALRGGGKDKATTQLKFVLAHSNGGSKLAQMATNQLSRIR